MAEEKQTTTDLVNKVIENFSLLHNDLEEVKNILVRNGIQSNGTTAKLAEEVTKLPEKAEENIKKSNEVIGLVDGTVDITGGFTFTPNDTDTLDDDNCIISPNSTEFKIPAGKKLNMFIPTDSVVNSLKKKFTNKEDRNIVLTIDNNTFMARYGYLTTGTLNIADVNLTINLNYDVPKVEIDGKHYFDFSKPSNWNPGMIDALDGNFGLGDYNAKILVKGEEVQYVKCGQFILSPNKYIKEVLCDSIIVDYRLLRNILYKSNVMEYNGEDKNEYDPLVVKFTDKPDVYPRVERWNYSPNTKTILPSFVQKRDPYADDGSQSEEWSNKFATEKAKEILGISANLADVFGRMVHIHIDQAKQDDRAYGITINSLDSLAMRLPYFNLDGSKKYNYSKRVWEDVASKTEDLLKYFEIDPSIVIDNQFLGADRMSKLELKDFTPFISASKNVGFVFIHDPEGYDKGITNKNALWAISPKYAIDPSYTLYSLKFQNDYSLNELGTPIEFTIPERSIGETYPLSDLDFSYTKDFNVIIEADNEESGYFKIGEKNARLLSTGNLVKFKNKSGTLITKIDMENNEVPLTFNRNISEVKASKITIPVRSAAFRKLYNGFLYISDSFTPTKYVLDDNVQIVIPNLFKYKTLSEYDYLGDTPYNHPDYRFDSDSGMATINFAKYVHCCISENAAALSNEDFTKYRLPLFNLDESKRYNYSTKTWVNVGDYSADVDNIPSKTLYPTKADELDKMKLLKIAGGM